MTYTHAGLVRRQLGTSKAGKLRYVMCWICNLMSGKYAFCDINVCLELSRPFLFR